MTTAPRALALFLFLLTPCLRASAQTTAVAPQAGARITVTSTPSGVRFAALGEVTHTRLEVFGPTGEQVFGSGFLAGNVRDWRPMDSQGGPLPDGTYTCVVTAREAGGAVSAKEGVLFVSGGQAAVQLGGGTTGEPVQAAGAKPARPSLPADDDEGGGAMTLTAHDGSDGQVTSTSGALTFRTGDFFSGADRERVRVTEDGRVGVGTATPEAALDVAGAVRAQGGFKFPDGTTLSSKEGRLTLTDAQGGESSPLMSAAGASDRLAKFDAGGALTDSAVTEAAGNVGIGTASPQATLEVRRDAAGAAGLFLLNGGGAPDSRSVFLIGEAAGDARYSYMSYNGSGHPTRPNSTFFTGAGAGGFHFFSYGGPGQTGGLITFNTSPALGQGGNDAIAERMRIDRDGNVGVGKASPVAKLDVAGAVNASQFNIGGSRVVAVGGDNTFVGNGAGANNNTNVGNSFFGKDAGFNNTTGTSNSFFGFRAGYINNGHNNAFFGRQAGEGNTQGYANAFFGKSSGEKNSSGHENTFIGYAAGQNNLSGYRNIFVGSYAGHQTNTSGEHNTLLGSYAEIGSEDRSNATAIGYRAFVMTSNSLVLGSISGQNGATHSVNVGIGTPSPGRTLDIVTGAGNGIRVSNSGNLFFRNGANMGDVRAMGVDGGDNILVGGVSYTSSIRFYTGAAPGGERMRVDSLGNVGIGTDSPNARLHVSGGDAAVTTQGNGLILRATNGTSCYRITVNNVGTLSTALVTCP